ncbi:MAG TPA: hypothetical protein H9844_08590, partial [Candidatus Evtepia faecigallinarum]|nr:hypothetical protein [Candidatus Evtepia faecigallinarum]
GRLASVEGTLRVATVDGSRFAVVETNGRKICSKNIKDCMFYIFSKHLSQQSFSTLKNLSFPFLPSNA